MIWVETIISRLYLINSCIMTFWYMKLYSNDALQSYLTLCKKFELTRFYENGQLWHLPPPWISQLRYDTFFKWWILLPSITMQKSDVLNDKYKKLQKTKNLTLNTQVKTFPRRRFCQIWQLKNKTSKYT